MEKRVGSITHYFPKVGVAVVRLEDGLLAGDQIRISGPHQNFSQRVLSMEIEHQTITRADRGQEVGLKVAQPVRPGDIVYRITPD
jgi:hypothetical protein